MSPDTLSCLPSSGFETDSVWCLSAAGWYSHRCRVCTISHGLQRELQRKRESIHYWCRTSELSRESLAWQQTWEMRRHVPARGDPRQEMKERDQELSNLWGNLWSLEVHQPRPRHRHMTSARGDCMQHSVSAVNVSVVVIVIFDLFCYFR